MVGCWYVGGGLNVGGSFCCGRYVGGAVRGFKEGIKTSEGEAPAQPGDAQQIAGQTIEGEAQKEKTP